MRHHLTAIVRTGTLPFPDAGMQLGMGYLTGPSTAGTFWIMQIHGAHGKTTGKAAISAIVTV